MKQRFSVRAIIEEDGKLIALKRANGRQTILHKYELPGGKVAYGEQPEDALRRYLHDDAGLHVDTAELVDAVTYIDHDDRDIQYLVLMYRVNLASGHHSIQLSENYNKYIWKTAEKIQQEPHTDLTDLLLGIIGQRPVANDERNYKDNVVINSTSGVTIFTDGGSRGNPGPSAAGYVIVDASKQVIDQGGEYLGITTNSQAEYQAVRLGLERAHTLGLSSVEFKIDSMMVVNQMNGVYKVKNRELWPIHERIRALANTFEYVRFTHVKREFNTLADGMANKILDAHAAQEK